MAKNVLCRCKGIENLSRDLKDISQKPDFQRDYMKLQEIYFMKKVGGIGVEWCYIGESWRKVAQIG